MQHSKNKVNKINSKIRTLCTIDTSDIDLCQLKPKTYTHLPASRTKSKSKYNGISVSYDQEKREQISPSNKGQKSKHKFGHEKKQTKVPISPPTQKQKTNVKQKGNYFAQTQGTLQKSPSQDRLADLQKSKERDINRKRSQSGWNKTMTRSKSRVKTQHSTINDAVFKSLLSKSSIKSRPNDTSLQQTYKIDTFQILQQLSSQIQHMKLMICRKHDKLYLLKKTKNPNLKQQLQNQLHLRQQPPSSHYRSGAFNYALKDRSANIQKLHRMYTQKAYLYAIYQYNGGYLSWNNETHVKLVGNMVKNDGEMLKHVIKQIAKGIHQLSGRGIVHSRVRLQNISVYVQDRKNILQMQGNIKLCNIHSAFPICHKQQLIKLPALIYTPPQLINLKLFESGQQFDRQLLQCISYYDQAWYVDVWALGVLMLELVAGQQVSIQKVQTIHKYDNNDNEYEYEGSQQNNDIHQNDRNIDIDDDDVSIKIQSQRTHDKKKNNVIKQQKQKQKQKHRNKKLGSLHKQHEKQQNENNINNQNQITLVDILEAQKSLLIQTESMIQRISFDKKLHNLLIRMLSVNPLDRPSPKDIIRDL